MIFQTDDYGKIHYVGHIIGFEDLQGWEDGAEYLNCLLSAPRAYYPEIQTWSKQEGIQGDCRWIPPPFDFGNSVVICPD